MEELFPCPTQNVFFISSGQSLKPLCHSQWQGCISLLIVVACVKVYLPHQIKYVPDLRTARV